MAYFPSRNIGAKIIPLTWKMYFYIQHLQILVELHVILKLYED